MFFYALRVATCTALVALYCKIVKSSYWSICPTESRPKYPQKVCKPAVGRDCSPRRIDPAILCSTYSDANALAAWYVGSSPLE